MPIEKNQLSPSNQIRTELNSILSRFTVSELEEVISDFGFSFIKKENIQDDVTFEEATYYFEHDSPQFLALSTSSKKTYKSELTLFKKFIYQGLGSDVTLKKACEPKVLLEYLSPFKATNTGVKKSAFLRSFFKSVLRNYGHGDIEDLKNILKIDRDNDQQLPKAFKKSQIAELIFLSQLSRNELRNYTLIWTFIGSGIRLSELCNLQIADIVKDTQTIKVIAKGNENKKKERKINQLSLLILLDYINFKYAYLKQNLPIEEYRELYVFSTNSGKTPISQRTVQIVIKDLIKQAQTITESEKARLSVHSFRHSFALYGLENGIDIFTLAKLLGHKSINTTAIYLKLFDDQLKEAIEMHPLAKEIESDIRKRLNESYGQ